MPESLQQLLEAMGPRRAGRNGIVPVDLKVRFLQNIKEDPETGCHIWTGYRMSASQGGYGFIRRGGRGSKGVLAHRLALEYAGVETDGRMVRHSCGNPACVRVGHLVVEGPLAPLRDRYFKSFSLADGNGCYEWNGTLKGEGYGTITDEVTGRTLLAHRLALELAGIPIPVGMSVLHACDNPKCVRPSHLRVGTRAENQADMARRNRGHKGQYPYGVKPAGSGFMARCGSTYLGCFRTIEEAAIAARRAKEIRYGLPDGPGSAADREVFAGK